MRDPFPDITTAAHATSDTLAGAADQLDRITARHTGENTTGRIFCPHCESWQTGDYCFDDLTTGAAFKGYVCFGCDGDVVTTEPTGRLTREAYVELCWINPAAGHLWRLAGDGTSYIPVDAREAVA